MLAAEPSFPAADFSLAGRWHSFVAWAYPMTGTPLTAEKLASVVWTAVWTQLREPHQTAKAHLEHYPWTALLGGHRWLLRELNRSLLQPEVDQ